MCCLKKKKSRKHALELYTPEGQVCRKLATYLEIRVWAIKC